MPSQSVDFGDARRHFSVFEGRGAAILAQIRHDAATQLLDEMKRARHAQPRRIGIHALLETEGGVGALPQGAGGLSHVVAGEFRRFEKDVFRLGLNLAVQSAHNPRESHGLASVADDEIFGRKRKLFFVQRDDFFALLRAAHDDLSAAELVRVKRVHRLAELEQDEIGDIHHGGNRAKPDSASRFLIHAGETPPVTFST